MPSPAAPPRPRVVLVVDDEPAIGRALRRLLERALPGVRVEVATSGPEALSVMARVPVDVILTDFRMPGMDGLEFLREAQRLAPGAPKALVTAFPDLQLAVNAVNDSRIQRFITKPWDSDEMVATVHRMLAGLEAEEQQRQGFARSMEALRQRLR